MRPREHYVRELEGLNHSLEDLAGEVKKAISGAVAAFEQRDTISAQAIIDYDSIIDHRREEIEQRVLVLIALQQPVAGDLRRILATLEIATELERIGDYAKRISKATLRSALPPTVLPQVPISQMGELAVQMLDQGTQAFQQHNAGVLASLEKTDDEIDRMEDVVRADMLALIQREPAAAEWAMDQTLVAHTLERVGDRVTNVAEQLVFAERGERVDLNS